MTFTMFSREFVAVSAARVLIRRAGRGPAVLLLHGFPETSMAWQHVAPALTDEFTVIAADLPGYGDSLLSDAATRDGQVGKRTMAALLAEAMTALGISTFAVVGHDRGARVAYRLALDHAERVRACAVLDVIPILDMAERITYEAARQMAHWFWAAQPSTLPETLIGLDPDRYVRDTVEQWGGGAVVDPAALEEYIRCMRNPAVRRTMAAEYRADRLDLAHDRADRLAAHRIACPVLALWAAGGLPEQFGDPLAIWRQWADSVDGRPLTGGHFIMEESPRELTALLRPFLKAALGSR